VRAVWTFLAPPVNGLFVAPPQAPSARRRREIVGLFDTFYTICTHFPHLILSGIFRQTVRRAAGSRRASQQEAREPARRHARKRTHLQTTLRCEAQSTLTTHRSEPPTCQPPYGTAATPGRSCCQDASPAPRSLALPLMRHSQSASARQCTCELRSSPRGKHT
jgi:hypothetical protein